MGEPNWSISNFGWQPERLLASPARTSPEHDAPAQGAPQASHGGLSEGQGSLPTSAATGATGHAGSSDSDQAAGGAGPKPAGRKGCSGRSRGRNGRAPAVCQVDGCGASLDSGKPFYRLQRICERHARAAVVTDASGVALRFCQQCTRLHPIADFEGSKRSCAAALLRRMERKQRQQHSARAGEGLAASASIGKRRAVRGGAGSSQPPGAVGNLSLNSRSHSSDTASGGTPGRSGEAAPAAAAAAAAAASPSAYGWEGCAPTMLAAATATGGSTGGQVTGWELPAPTMLDGRSSGTATLVQPASSPSSTQLDLAQQQQQHQHQHQQQQQHQHQQQGAPLLPGSSPASAAQPFLSPLAAARQHAAALMAAGVQASALCDWIDLERLALLNPGTASLRQLLGEVGEGRNGLPLLLGAGAVGQPLHAGAAGPTAQLPPASAAASAPPAELSLLSSAELDELLVMDPDELASALLGRSAAACSHGLVGHMACLEGGSVPAQPHTCAVAPLAHAPFGVAGRPLAPGGAPQAPSTSSGGSGGVQAPTVAGSWGGSPSASDLQRMALGSAPQPGLAPTAMPALASWSAAADVAATLHTATAAVPQAALGLAPLPPQAELVVIRFSLKAYGLYPDQLPPALQRELQQTVANSPTVLTGAVRSGCTHLTTSVLLTAEEAAVLAQPAGSAGALALLLRSWQGGGADGQPWRLPSHLPMLRVVAQADDRSAALLLQPLEAATEGGAAVATPPGGAVCALRIGSAASERQRRLVLSLAGPAATTVSAAAGMFALQCADWQQLALGDGDGGGARRVLHCRCRGHHAAVSLLQPHERDLSSDDDAGTLGPVPEQEQPTGLTDSARDSDSDAEGLAEVEAAEEERWAAALQGSTAAEAWVPAAEKQWGLYEFELASGPLMGAAVPVLVLPDGWEEAAAELQQLQEAEASGALRPGHTARVLQLTNLVLLHLEQQREQAARTAALPPTALQRLAAAARWLCALCVRCRWPALLRRLLPAVTADGETPSQAAAALDALLAPVGTLGMAAAAGSAPLLLGLTSWAVSVGYRWHAHPYGDSGVTPLHLAAAQGPALSLQAAAALVGALGPVAAALCWRTARAGDWTPRQVASAARCSALAELLEPIVSPTSSPEAPAELPALSGPTAELPASGSGQRQRAAAKAEKTKEAAALSGGEAADAQDLGPEAALLLRDQLELELGTKKDDAGDSASGSGGTGEPYLGRRLPATPAELAAWQQRPLSPAVLAGIAAAAVLVVVGLSAALRAGLY